jgi:hypothetical protein
VAYLLIAGLLAVGLLVLIVLAIRLRLALRRFGRVSGWLNDYVTSRSGMLRARSAALNVAFGELRRDGFSNERPRTIVNSLEREDSRA